MRGYEMYNVNILRQLGSTDYHLAEDKNRSGEPCILDCDGVHVMDVPPMLLTLSDEFGNGPNGTGALDTILIDLANAMDAVERHGADNGERYGREQAQLQFQMMLGTRQIADNLERLSDTITSLQETVWRLGK